MKRIYIVLILAALAALSPCSGTAAQPANTAPHNADRVQFKNGAVWRLQAGQNALVNEELNLARNILVKTNGQFAVNGGQLRALQEGQILSADGMLTSPDGSMVPVVDHIVMKNGRPQLYRDGTPSLLSSPTKLGDGTYIQPDGFLIDPQGRRLRMLDGQLFRLDGQVISTKDTVSLQKGKVTVQKDGSLFTVAPGRTLMMNDGSKVFGDGTVILKDGTTRKLAEGELLTLEGVVTRR